MKIKAVLLALFFFGSGVLAIPLPDNYLGLAFGADTAALRRVFPQSENQRFAVDPMPSISGRGCTVYRIIFKKGMVDSAWLYFSGNRFAMAVDYYYPGEEYFRKAVNDLTGRFGQFVGAGQSFWKRQDNRTVLIVYRKTSGLATVTWMDEKLSEKLRQDDQGGAAMESIDRELLQLKRKLDSLDKPEKKKGN